MQIKDRIIKWLKQKVKDSGAKGVVFGLSGGVDSAVVGIICKNAFPQASIGLIMPCFSHPQDEHDAIKLAKKFKIKIKEVDLCRTIETLYLELEGGKLPTHKNNLAVANLKPRLRMAILYYYANKYNYLVVGTGNKSEAIMGYFTKYGDGGVDLLPIAGLLKTEVRALARQLGVPSAIIDKAPSAGLWDGQTDEGEMGITYEELDNTIRLLEAKKYKQVDQKNLLLIQKRMLASRHKFAMPAIFKP